MSGCTVPRPDVSAVRLNDVYELAKFGRGAIDERTKLTASFRLATDREERCTDFDNKRLMYMGCPCKQQKERVTTRDARNREIPEHVVTHNTEITAIAVSISYTAVFVELSVGKEFLYEVAIVTVYSVWSIRKHKEALFAG